MIETEYCSTLQSSTFVYKVKIKNSLCEGQKHDENCPIIL